MWLKATSIHSMEYDIPPADQAKGIKASHAELNDLRVLLCRLMAEKIFGSLFFPFFKRVGEICKQTVQVKQIIDNFCFCKSLKVFLNLLV